MLYTLFLVGSAAGLMSGALGVAGFPLYVPALMVLYKSTAPDGMLLPVILLNAFAVALCNCLVSWYKFHQHGTVHYPDAMLVMRGATPGLVMSLVGCIVLGTIAFADRMFGIYLIAMAAFMFWSQMNKTQSAQLPKDHLPAYGFLGGMFAGALGFNGGSFFIPMLRHAGHDIKSAIATAMVPCALMCLLAIGTLLAYGYIKNVSMFHLEPVAILAVASTVTSVLGTTLKHRLPAIAVTVGVVLAYAILGFILVFRLH